jgi:hypothetical protein
MSVKVMNSFLRNRALAFATNRGLQGAKSGWSVISQRSYGTVLEEVVENKQASSTLEKARNADGPRHDWSKQEIKEIYDTPLMLLALAAVCLLALCAPVMRITNPAVGLQRYRAQFIKNSTTRPISRCAH